MKTRFSHFPPAGEWITVIATLPVEYIQRVCITIEGYDNLALVRTPVQGIGRLHIYTWENNADLVRSILTDLGREFPVHIEKLEPGMFQVDEIWE